MPNTLYTVGTFFNFFNLGRNVFNFLSTAAEHYNPKLHLFSSINSIGMDRTKLIKSKFLVKNVAIKLYMGAWCHHVLIITYIHHLSEFCVPTIFFPVVLIYKYKEIIDEKRSKFHFRQSAKLRKYSVFCLQIKLFISSMAFFLIHSIK